MAIIDIFHHKKIIAVIAVVIFFAVIFWGFWKNPPEVQKPPLAPSEEKTAKEEIPGKTVPEKETLFRCPEVLTDDFGLGEKPSSKKAKAIIESLGKSTQGLSEKIRSFKRTGDKEDLGDIRDNLEKVRLG